MTLRATIAKSADNITHDPGDTATAAHTATLPTEQGCHAYETIRAPSWHIG